MTRLCCQSRRGISLPETVVSILLIGFVLVSTLQIVSPMVNSTSLHTDRLVAANLASELRDEIATKLFVDPDAVDPDSIGLDADDARINRLDFDDIDDYHGWSSSPPEISRGVANTGLSGWSRTVKVSHVLLADAATESPTNTGLKGVTVIFSKDGTPLCTLHSLHSQAADTLGFIVPAQSGGAVVADAEVKVK